MKQNKRRVNRMIAASLKKKNLSASEEEDRNVIRLIKDWKEKFNIDNGELTLHDMDVILPNLKDLRVLEARAIKEWVASGGTVNNWVAYQEYLMKEQE